MARTPARSQGPSKGKKQTPPDAKRTAKGSQSPSRSKPGVAKGGTAAKSSSRGAGVAGAKGGSAAPKAPRSKKRGPAAAGDTFLGPTHDDLLASRLLEELEFRHGIDVSTLDIAVRDAVATVRGLVSDDDERDAVRDTIQEHGGINDVDELIQVASTRREEERDIARQVQEVIESEPDLLSENIQVACIHRKIVLRGTVHEESAKAKAGLLALRQPDVQRIRNRIVVVRD